MLLFDLWYERLPMDVCLPSAPPVALLRRPFGRFLPWLATLVGTMACYCYISVCFLLTLTLKSSVPPPAKLLFLLITCAAFLIDSTDLG